MSTCRTLRLSALFAFISFVAVAIAPAQTTNGTAVLKESISLTGPVMWLMSGSPGMVLVVVKGNDVVIEGYGETAKGNGKQPNAKSLIRLGQSRRPSPANC